MDYIVQRKVVYGPMAAYQHSTGWHFVRGLDGVRPQKFVQGLAFKASILFYQQRAICKKVCHVRVAPQDRCNTMHVGFVTLLSHGATFCKTSCWWGKNWCFANGGPGSSSGPRSQVQWNAFEHIMPYLQTLHAWLLKVGANMPAITKAAPLSAPVELRINHQLLEANKDRHATKNKMPTPTPKTRSNNQALTSKVQGPRLHMGGGKVS